MTQGLDGFLLLLRVVGAVAVVVVAGQVVVLGSDVSFSVCQSGGKSKY